METFNMNRTVKVEDAGASGATRAYLTLGVRSVTAITPSELTSGYTLDQNRRRTVVIVNSEGRDTAFNAGSVARKLTAIANDGSQGCF
jgi:hypothetical protein